MDSRGGDSMLFKLNGLDVKTPSKCDITVSDIDADSQRNAKGVMIRNKIRHIHGFQISYNEIKPFECAEITSQLNNSEFTLDVFCPIHNKEEHLICYAGDRSISTYSDKLSIYVDFAFDIIEI